VAQAGHSIAAWIQKAKDLSAELSPRSVFAVFVDVDSSKENDILARQRNTYAFVPSMPEGTSLARIIKVLDASFLDYRTKAPMQDSASVNAAFGAVRDLVKEFHDITDGMTRKTGTRFVPPKAYASYISRGAN